METPGEGIPRSNMEKQLKILIVEDVATDAELVEHELYRSGLHCIVRRVDTEADFLREIQALPDLILSDFTLPAFDGLSALRLVREASPEIPFIFLSGTIGEEQAIEALKQGATDYVLKTNMGRLVPAVSRALQEAGEHARRQAAEEALRQSEERLQAMLDNSTAIIYLKDVTGRFLLVNRQLENLLHLTGDQIVGKIDHDILPKEIADTVRANDLKVLEAKVPLEFEETFALDDGLHTYISMKFPLCDAQGMPYAVGGISTDITARKEVEEELRHLAHHDALTGLANQTLLKDHLDQALAFAHRHGQRAAVLFLDLDRFKFINDTLGHEAGDRLLQDVAHRLRGCVRISDTVARMGGDEFVLVLTDIVHAEDTAVVVQKIFNALLPEFVLDGHKVFVTPSIGISFYPDDAEDAQTLLKYADLAMYRAKEQGRNNYHFYTPEMTARIQERLVLEHDLRRALAQGELFLHYQPKVNLDSGQIVGMEALLRWQHPERGLIFPAQFVSLAEETGLIVPIGALALQTACRQTRLWQEAGLTNLTMAVNFSARQFKHVGLVDTVAQILEETALTPACLKLEITESLLMQDTENSIAALQALKEMGIRMVIDDFGTGYSSLSYLKRFSIDCLKIDQSFVQDVPTDPNDAAITKAIIAMAHSLGIKVVAEGVETQEQLEFLRIHGCDEIQGYYFSHPMSAEAAAVFLQEDRRLVLGST